LVKKEAKEIPASRLEPHIHDIEQLFIKDWGLNWNTALEAGGVLVADEVKISCEVELVKQA
jgi:hypothetical protein